MFLSCADQPPFSTSTRKTFRYCCERIQRLVTPIHEGLLPTGARDFLGVDYHGLEPGKRYVYWLVAVSGDYRRDGAVTMMWGHSGGIPAVGEYEPGALRWRVRED